MILPNADQFPSRPAPAELTAERAELAAVVTRAQAGDMDAQSDLVRRYSRRIAGHVRSIIHQTEAIDDVTQMIFIKMVRRLSRLRDPALFECWLFTLSRNTSVDFIRRRNRRPLTVAGDETLAELPDTSTATVTSEIMDELEGALAQLSPIDRTLIGLYVQGNSYSVMAAHQGLTPGAVKARLHRVRPFLRECLGAADTRPRRLTSCRALSASRFAA